MLNPNMNYPYPVIRVDEEDYRTTIFKGELAVNLQPNGYLVKPDFKINNDGIVMLVFAIIFLILYILGGLFPNTTVKFIQQISLKMYKNSENINVPSLIEAKRIFLKRLIYILVCCNICLFLSLITYLI